MMICRVSSTASIAQALYALMFAITTTWHSPRTDLLFGDDTGSGYEAPNVS